MALTTGTREKLVWTLQIVLALLFLFAGGSKLVMTDAQLTSQPPYLPPLFLRFIGVCEALGGLGLLLPMLLKIRPGLTPAAAVCLVLIMIGATIVSTMTPQPATAVVPFVVGALLVYVAYVRWPLLRSSASARQYV